MRILSIGETIVHTDLEIININESDLPTLTDINLFQYIIISGGDGTVRRVVQTLHHIEHHATIILNPMGSFNFIAKLHKIPKLHVVLNKLRKSEILNTEKHHYFSVNDKIFLFSAGNMGDLQHIFLSETLRFGILKRGIAKYLLAVLFLLPTHLLMTPFMLFSPRKFFIFTPLRIIKKFGNFYGEVKEISIDLDNGYNHIELDGDVVTIREQIIEIRPAGHIFLVI